MKTVYTIINGKPYRVNQNTNVPTSITFRTPGASSSVSVDVNNKAVTQNITINTIKKPGTKSNAEMYANLVDMIITNKITEIRDIQNCYKVYIDYSVFENDQEVDHSIVFKPMEALDQAILLGVATNNECVFRRVKSFNPNIEFTLRNTMPHGIMGSSKKKYTLKINNVCIFEDFNRVLDPHEATYEHPYAVASCTVDHFVEDMALIYSTENEGIDLAPVSLEFMPRKVGVKMNITLANYIVAYDDGEINKLLIQNIKNKYDEEHNPGKDDDIDSGETGGNPGEGGMIPSEDKKPDADGNYTPDEDGYYTFYERCRETTPKSLLVVEDLIPDSAYDVDSMIKISKVIKDVPDISVGEYVIFREVFVDK